MWVPGDSSTENQNPSDLKTPVGYYDMASEQQTDQGIAAAQEAFMQWGESNPSYRAVLLERVGQRLAKESSRLGKLLSMEEGKTLQESKAEVLRASRTFQYFAQTVKMSHGQVIPSDRPGVTIHTRKKPVGVVGIISPWNFPIAVPAWKLAPALAAGNTVVFKPAESVPATAWELAKIIHEAGFPPGVFNLLTGKGSIVGERFATHTGVSAVTFTGSTGVGQHLLRTIHAKSNRRIQAEMGGKNPIVIASDADMNTAVQAVTDSAYGSTGQRCTASSRIIVADTIHDQFVDKLCEKIQSLTVGHALDPSTNVGPVANSAQLEVNLKALEDGKSEGAELVLGGQLIQRETQGHFLTPALFINSKNNMAINQNEIFGPIACVISVNDLDEAIAVANDTPYGLSSGIVTSSLSTSEHFQNNSQAGLISVNTSPAVSELQAPFGGVKQSSYGPREQGEAGLEFYRTDHTHFVSI